MCNYQLISNRIAFNSRLQSYPKEIRDGMSASLTQTIATYDIEDKGKIIALSFLCDLVSASIESSLLSMIHNIKPSMEDSYGFEFHGGENIRYLYYPDYIKTPILHAIRAFKLAYREKFEGDLDDWIDDLIIEELADNIAYYIDICTQRHSRQ
ncbi:hypothetical protein QTV49_000327 [Vibrio vulnificus]|nr:hypothetical protein [Vibrio vulnificus]